MLIAVVVVAVLFILMRQADAKMPSSTLGDDAPPMSGTLGSNQQPKCCFIPDGINMGTTMNALTDNVPAGQRTNLSTSSGQGARNPGIDVLTQQDGVLAPTTQTNVSALTSAVMQERRFTKGSIR